MSHHDLTSLPETSSSRVGGFHSAPPSSGAAPFLQEDVAFPVGHRLCPFAPPTRGGGMPLRQNSGSKGAPSATREPISVRVHFVAGLAERPLLRH